jgi:peptidyl-prolyl cis-trans isomerase B (cyclophilin B)
VAANNRQDREAREARARLRAYQARQGVHQHRVKRRGRDNVIAAIVVVAVGVIAVGAQLAYFNGGPGTPKPTPSASSTPTPTPTAGANSGDVPPVSLAENRSWTGTMKLNDVELGFTLDGAAAPQAVAATIGLVQSGFYEGNGCHRLTDGGFFVLQCGGGADGTSDPGFSYGPVENAPADDLYPAGTIAMARQGSNGYSMSSQFFIVYEDTTIPSDTAGGYSVIGQVTSGLDQLKAQITDAGVADGSNDGAPKVPVTLSAVTVQ